MRLQKYMAQAGIGSRRACEEFIKNGEVTVNGAVAQIGDRVEDGDVVEYNGKTVALEENKVYIMLFKPVGVVTTLKDELNRKTVADIVDIPERVYPVGRLDLNTSGLLLLTNDGELANELTHPRFEVDKTYKALIRGEVNERELQALRDGVILEDGPTAPAKVKLIKFEEDKSYVEITIREGRNRQVRRMFEAVGHKVSGLRRIKVGRLGLGDLKKGEYRHLTSEETEYLKRLSKKLK